MDGSRVYKVNMKRKNAFSFAFGGTLSMKAIMTGCKVCSPHICYDIYEDFFIEISSHKLVHLVNV